MSRTVERTSEQFVMVHAIYGGLALALTIATYVLLFRTTSSLDRLVKALELKWTREAEQSIARWKLTVLTRRFGGNAFPCT